MRRHPTILPLFLLFFILGICIGLAWAWLVAPNQTTATPADLNPQDREIYLRLVADSYTTDSNSALAQRRLAALGPNSEAQLASLVAADLESGRSIGEASRLATLAFDLGIDTPAVALLVPPRPLPAATVERALDFLEPTGETNHGSDRFRLLSRHPLCLPGEAARRIEIVAHDRTGEPLSGITVEVNWENGHDTFFTGFDAGKGAGYGDFEMEPGIVYRIAVGGDEPSAIDLQTQACPDAQEGGWQLEYQEQGP